MPWERVISKQKWIICHRRVSVSYINGDRNETISKWNQMAEEEYKSRNNWFGKCYLLGMVQEIKIWWH